MKLAIMGAVFAATIISALPASAQVVVRTDSNGVVVSQRHNDDWRRRENMRHREWRRHRADCRTIRTRIVTPSGRVIIKTRRSC